MIKVYLDISAHNRPFDDQTQPKIFLESQAVVIILQMVEARMVDLVRGLRKNKVPVKQPALKAIQSNRLGCY